jgi:hypothetical protein
MPNPLVEALEDIARTATQFKEQGKCWVCEEEAKPKIHSEAGEREFQISGTCEECFDRMFEEES